MAHPVIHFEIIGKQPEQLRRFYGELFGWEYDTSGPVSPAVSDAGQYGFVEPPSAGDGPGIPGGVGGGAAYEPHIVFYIGVPHIEATLQQVEQLGGKRRMGPERSPGTNLLVAHFTDPEGNLIGLASVG